jgi:hypothetical protein
MSWSVAAIGKTSAVRTSIASQFANGGKCVEPEESIRQGVAALLDKALESTSPSYAIKVVANGSQGYKNYSKPEEGVYNSLNISLEVQHGFIE